MGLRQQRARSEIGIVALEIKSIGRNTLEYYNGTGVSALDLLKIKHDVKLSLNKQFVQCIDGVCVENEYGWSLYVNDKYINKGVDSYIIKGGDEVRFEFSRGGKN